MKLYLIRHGRQCSRLCNVDVDLSEEGYRQASLLGERLRAVETAQAANLYWNVEHFIRPELGEISFGDMEGMSDEEIAAAYKDFKAQQGRMEEDLPYPGGECAADVVRRAEPVFMEMVHSGYDRIAVVTHGGVIRSMVAHYLGIPMARWRILGASLENCSITQLDWDEENSRFLLERFNDYAHLEACPDLLRRAWVGTEN